MMSLIHNLSAWSAHFKIYKPVVGSGMAAWVEGVVVG